MSILSQPDPESESREINRKKNNEKSKRYRDANKEKIAARNKVYREANKEKVKEWDKRHRDANKEDINEKRRLRYQNNKETISNRNKKYREANKEKVKERKRQYRETNKEKINKKKKKYYEENKQKIKESIRVYRHSNRGLLKVKHERRRDRLKAQNNQTITPDFITSLFEKAKSCPYCGKTMLDGSGNMEDLKSLDHLIPIAKGGLHAQHNVTVCCHSCNSSKNSKSFPEWLDCLDEPHRTRAEKLYIKKYGASPIQGVLPLTFGC